MIKLLTESRDLMQARFKNGAVSEMDVARAQTELSTAQTSLFSIVRRANAEHALAVLLGKPPAEFNLAKQTLSQNPIQVPGFTF